ncbi:MAG: hypothetical protein V4700_02085 [Pseudomonadota bacterium]
MKLLRIGLPIFIGVVSISLLTACGGGSGGPGGAPGAAGAGGASGGTTTSGLLGGNLAGLSLNSDGGLNLTASALNTLGLQVNALTPADVADLSATVPGIGTLSAEAIRSNGQLIGIQLPTGGAFALPGVGTTLPGGIRLPTLPLNLLGR